MVKVLNQIRVLKTGKLLNLPVSLSGGLIFKIITVISSAAFIVFFENYTDWNAQYTWAQDVHPRLLLIHANTLTNETDGGEVINRLIGDVLLRQGDVTLKSDQVWIYTDQNKVIFADGVHISDSLHTIKSDRIIYQSDVQEFYSPGVFSLIEGETSLSAGSGTYYRKKQRFIGQDNVIIKAPNYVMTCKLLEFFENPRVMHSIGDVRFTDVIENYKVTGSEAHFEESENYLLVTGSPHLYLYDADGMEEFNVAGEKMELFQDQSTAVVTGNVRITKDSLTAVCQNAVYLKRSDCDSVYLRKDPVIYHNSGTISGNEILMVLKGKNIEHMNVIDNARIRMSVDSTIFPGKYQELRGKKITVNFLDNVISQMTAERNAESFYYIIEEGSNQGGNYTQGGKITIMLNNGRMTKVIVNESSKGTFFPPHLTSELENK